MKGALADASQILDPEVLDACRGAIRALGLQRVLLAIHDQSFPADSDDLGRGTPYSGEAGRFLAFAARLGFHGVQLGPQGQTSEINPSPYDGMLFSRNTLNVPLRDLLQEGLVSKSVADSLLAKVGKSSAKRVDYAKAFAASAVALKEAFTTHRARPDDEGFTAFRAQNAEWLERDSLYCAAAAAHGSDDWTLWGGALDAHPDQRLFAPRPEEAKAMVGRRASLAKQYSAEMEQHRFAQYLVHRAHQAFRDRAKDLQLRLYGDLQVGFSHRDVWAWRELLLEPYRMGAPPSRTNPEGQAWNYAVLDPTKLVEADGELGPALRFVRSRMEKMLRELDGVRIDHPHGLVCPWVYLAGTTDPLTAVQTGARLYCSPSRPDHPLLARFAIARPEQLNPTALPYADDWVRGLEDAQVQAYSRVLDTVIAAARKNHRAVDDLLCEVLSTQPYPLQRVLERHGLGRFRVTQKANLDDPNDVYRSENARSADWIMVGNHDTKPLWLLIDEWERSATLGAQADYLAARLCPDAAVRPVFAKRLKGNPLLVAQAKMADVFASPARNVMVFFADLLGLKDVYNRPGTVDAANWTLRVPPNWEASFREAATELRAMNLPLILSWAMTARGMPRNEEERGLLAVLARAAPV